MPETIDEFKFGRLTRPNKYEEYLDGNIWLFTAEELEEYTKGAQTVRSGVYSAAARTNMRVRSQIREDGALVVQAVEKE